ncbi:phage major capsid protein [Gordonibacter sp. Marseille-P4307]|uniref:phage major capsid protein n=1 Tax=Gordonibacter sp. Marseille-P4307 TaxID=2161815 RepID=UPI000F53C4F6|nr:phage major capsid protein [Gordonibacter sp. Marseille-P4307]
MTIQLNKAREAGAKLYQAFETEGADRAGAFEEFGAAIAADVTEQFKAAQAANDAAVLQARGFRTLTSEETAYYQRAIDALTSVEPKQAFAAMGDNLMPITVIEDVMRNISKAHPLLARVKAVPAAALTRWVRNRDKGLAAVWGELNGEIAKEITSAFDVVDIKQGKLSCFALVSQDMLKLGPVWLDGYVTTVLSEAIAIGLETGLISGNGIKGQPVGLDRDIHNGVSISSSTGYPKKQAVALADFGAKAYGAAVATLMKDESGKDKAVDIVNGTSLALIVNNNTYLTKVMPGVRAQGLDGVYRDSFPVATEVIPSVAVADGEGILALLDEYEMFVGADRGIEFSDDAKFLEDQRAFKVVTYAAGMAYDNTTATVLNLANVAEAAVPVKVKGTVSTKASA